MRKFTVKNILHFTLSTAFWIQIFYLFFVFKHSLFTSIKARGLIPVFIGVIIKGTQVHAMSCTELLAVRARAGIFS
jgi:hypothetical protein